MNTAASTKARASHQSRNAYFYVRQSTLRQLLNPPSPPCSSTTCASGHSPSAGRRNRPPAGAFFGSTVGNFEPTVRRRFLRNVAATMAPDDRFLLGADLRKDPGRLVRAYDDAARVTTEFNRNVLHVLNK
jgi:Histidine-specific methyltransferase, SAM-dependent